MTSRSVITDWFLRRSWSAFPFQLETWDAIVAGKNGLLHAPTGSGKTYAVWLGALQALTGSGCKVLWITPLRALAKDITEAMTEAAVETGSGWTVGLRTGDTSAAEKQRQRTKLPDALVITPESVHVLLSTATGTELLSRLQLVVVDEWHELLGGKRGVQTELALARLRRLNPSLRCWGISATIGNMDVACDVLFAPWTSASVESESSATSSTTAPASSTTNVVRITAPTGEPPEITTLLPDTVERFPWSGHLGTVLADAAHSIVTSSQTTLVFTNTRSQAEIWYQTFLDMWPDLLGTTALHHGSLDSSVRTWVEDAVHDGRLKAVFCTSSLDLGVDFAPVDSVIQVGSPKGTARFLQRAGRSGHRPGVRSRIAFLPTHSLEIVEGAAIRRAVETRRVESRQPIEKPIDVLIQWLVTIACGDGFTAAEMLADVRSTYAYQHLSDAEWLWCLDFITTGGASLGAYDDYHKVVLHDGRYHVANGRLALRHRMNIGTISSDAALTVKIIKGSTLGTLEESFASRLEEGDAFWFAGQCLEFVDIKDMTVRVRRTHRTDGIVPRWGGGRMPLSTELSDVLRDVLHDAAEGQFEGPEMQCVQPLFQLQDQLSRVPRRDEVLVEHFQSNDGYHVVFYPFEGRLVHEGLAALFALRISRIQPQTFTMAMNDYGLELLSDRPIPLEEVLERGLLSQTGLTDDILASANGALMARRRFRDIARISGLIFTGYPSKQKRPRHIQAGSDLFFDVFTTYDTNNLLLHQAFSETLTYQLEEERLRLALQRMSERRLVITEPPHFTPFSFPIVVDRLRERLGSERLEDRVRKIVAEMEAGLS